MSFRLWQHERKGFLKSARQRDNRIERWRNVSNADYVGGTICAPRHNFGVTAPLTQSVMRPLTSPPHWPLSLSLCPAPPGLRGRPTSSSPCWGSWPRRARAGAAGPGAWCAWRTPSSAAWHGGSPPPSSRRRWRSTRSSTCGRSTRAAPASPSCEEEEQQHALVAPQRHYSPVNSPSTTDSFNWLPRCSLVGCAASCWAGRVATFFFQCTIKNVRLADMCWSNAIWTFHNPSSSFLRFEVTVDTCKYVFWKQCMEHWRTMLCVGCVLDGFASLVVGCWIF